MAAENQNPNLVAGRQTPMVPQRRQTPISQRRPLQRINFNAAVLSPTKRRKQTHAEDLAVSPVKPCGAPREVSSVIVEREKQTFTRWSSDDREAGSLLLEVFRRLDVKGLIGNAAPACKLWREVAHSKELWSVFRAQLRLVDQFLVTEKVVERRSKGRLFKCKQLGTGEAVLLRMVDLELTNAGKDDGVPTSFLREAALLKRLQHPNVIRHFGSEILGKRAVMCTEYIFESFTAWYKRLEVKSASEKVLDIKGNFRQLLTGLQHCHHQGVMHRNLKPDNIFIDAQGMVKLGDFTTTRMLDIPFQAYTPEDPKERDRSGREMRRLWYRAPELILRDEIYGPKVDTWSVGCLLAEAASGRALFQSDSEIDHLFRVFRLTGTPTVASWPEVVTMKNFSPKFPVYSGFDLAQVTRATILGSTADQDALMQTARPDRDDILQNLMRVASVLGAEGMFVLDQLVAVTPSSRAGADATLASTFFSSSSSGGGGGKGGAAGAATAGSRRSTELSPSAQQWLHGAPAAEGGAAGEGGAGAGGARTGEVPGGAAKAAKAAKAVKAAGTPEPAPPSRARPPATLSGPSGEESASCPPVSVPSSMMPAHMVWNILTTMQRHERGSCRANVLPRLPPGFDAAQRTVMMDFIIGLANSLSLTDYTLHLAGRIVDAYLAQHAGAIAAERVQVVGATCLKIADVFAEQSKEYYKQENAVEYAEATYHQATSEQMLICEKDVLPKLNFDLHMPTTHWFIQCYLTYARFNQQGLAAKTASFIGDLTLLDYDLLQYPPSLRAQCSMVLAVFLVQQAKSQRRRSSPRPPATPAASAPPPLTAAPAPASASTAPAPSSGATGGASGVARSDCSLRQRSSARAPEAEGANLTYLEHWDRHVRDQACQGNIDIDAEMCLQAVVRTLAVLRREWKSLRLTAVEVKHASLSRTLVYPERFPVSKLVRYILPNVQQRVKRLLSE